ncbi:MAG TPA: hypothetical protein VFO66_11440, partial [Gemmatimonadaceae bacterium]|nr:hypothetical protein [Gemmatimonadaceae bacterium]
PYYIVSFPLNGSVQLAPGFLVQDDMVRVPANPGNNPSANQKAGRLQIVFPSVALLDAQALDLAVDSTSSDSTGTVRFNPALNPTQVAYELRVSGC